MTEEMTPKEYFAKIRAGELQNTACPIKRLTDILGSKWATEILYQLVIHPTMRFGEFKRQIPALTNTMLANSLRKMEERGIISRTQYNEIPPRVEYSLTELGHSLQGVVFEAAKWCERYDQENSDKL